MKTGGILVGIEHEFFLFHSNGEALSYGTADAVFQRLFGLLGGEFIASSRGHIYGLEYQTESGPLSLKHEAGTHILEIAFPFRRLNCGRWRKVLGNRMEIGLKSAR
ncbi:MAG: hypothetical protein WCQ57_14675 [Verrucomicrobiota bacterium]